MVQLYRDDLTSDAAQKVQHRLRDLGLPTLADVRGEFEQLAPDSGVLS